jgi:hypothetical protein
MDKRDNNYSSPSKDASQILFLSLFLLLLAFFILLNSMATIEETRSRKVMTSVAATFRAIRAPDTDAWIAIADLGPAAEPERLLEAMKQLWVTSVPVVKVETLTPGRIMQIAVPSNELFLGGEANLRRDRHSLFERLARLLTVSADGFAHEIELVHGSDATAPELPFRRAVALAQALVSRGAPDDAVSVGLREADPKSIRIRFMIRSKGDAHLTFGESLR